MRFLEIIKNIITDDKKFLILVFTLAIFLRVAFLLTVENRYYFSDSLEYEDSAVQILSGQGFGDFKRAPLYSVWMAGIFFFTGQGNILALRLVDAVLGAFLCVVLFYIGKTVYNRSAGVIAAGFSVFYPIFVFLPSLNYPTLPSTLLITLGVYFTVSLKRFRKNYLSILAGMFFGLSALAVAPTATIVIAVIVWLLFFSKLEIKSRLNHSLLIAVTFLLTLTPWILRNYSYYGEFVPIRKGVERHIFSYENGTIKNDKQKTTQFKEKIELIRKNSATFLWHYNKRFMRFWRLAPSRKMKSANPAYNLKFHEKDQRITKTNKFSRSDLTFIVNTITFGPILIFSILGLFLNRKHLPESLILILPCLILALTYSFFYTNVRYRIPIEPLMIVFAANSFYSVFEAVKEKIRESKK